MAERLSLRTKLGFGVGDLGGNLFFTMMGFYLLFFLTDVIGLAAGLAGVALWIGKAWDAVTDPAVGYLSDRTRSKMGRRRPFIFYGSFLLLISMVVMFTNPGLSSSAAIFVWATLAFCLLNTAFTLVNIPYAALLPELTRDFDQRTVLTGYRMTFAVVGTFIGAGIVLPLADAFTSVSLGWSVMGGVTGAVMLVTALLTVWAIREPTEHGDSESVDILGTVRRALKMKPFMLSVLPWVLHTSGVTVIQGALLYYFRHIYGNEGMFQLALVVLLGSTMVCIPFWVMISKRIGKKLSYNIGMAIFAAVVILFFFLGHQLGVTFALVVMGIAGTGFATHYVMPHAILPDVVEFSYAEYGERNEGVFYGLWTFASKIGQSLAFLVNGLVLSLFGYERLLQSAPSTATSGETIGLVAENLTAKLGIRLLTGPIPALFFVAGIIVLSFYPINHDRYKKILEQIRSREGS